MKYARRKKFQNNIFHVLVFPLITNNYCHQLYIHYNLASSFTSEKHKRKHIRIKLNKTCQNDKGL